MQRTLLNVLASLIAAAVIGTALTALFWDSDDEPLALQTPTGTATLEPTLSPPPTPTTTPEESETPSPSPTETAEPAGPPPSPAPSALSVNCEQSPKFCTDTTGRMVLKENKLSSSGSTPHGTDYGDVPDVTMTWKLLRSDGNEARNGDKVAKLQVEVLVTNDTNRTYVFPRREIALDVFLDGKKFHEITTTGGRFDMRPGGKLSGRFDIPIAYDGDYTWRGKTTYSQS